MNQRIIAVAAIAWLTAPAASGAQDLDAIARAEWPAVSRPWSGSDYATAGKLLAEGRVPLPRLSDPDGAALVMRFVAPENLEAVSTPEVPVQARFLVYQAMIGGASQILNAYLRLLGGAASSSDLPHEEFARLIGFMLRLTVAGDELMDEILPTIPRDDTYVIRMEGLKRFRTGLTNVLLGAEASLAETKLYTPADLAIIVDGMAAALPRLRRALARDVVIELRRKLERDRQRFAGEDGQKLDAMIRLLAEQEGQAPAGAAPPTPRAAPAPEPAPSRG